ncbi:element excision factor XisH family protein [Dolichospermum sp. UHCC 0259]|uniref:element excision factor XisH family protein n=1 Tax=Dolichospermum sp. UHCC 0259 TaxID=2590010 RepID=UPI001445BEFF|nr:hypothetical protein [Dolichospermum sp. UHCC 0259]
MATHLYIIYLGTDSAAIKLLQQLEPNRRLYLAIRQETYSELFQEPVGKILLENQRLCLLVFDSEQEIILKWIP